MDGWSVMQTAEKVYVAHARTRTLLDTMHKKHSTHSLGACVNNKQQQ